jgi:uncharacterized protein (DUF2336 family)
MGNTALIAELESAVTRSDQRRCARALRDITDEFISDMSPLAPDKADMLDLVLLVLTRSVENESRAALSEKLADLPHAPPKTTNALALDNVLDVAAPVLSRSGVVEESTLLEVARNQGQGHLLAVAKRPHVSEVVTDVLVDRGDDKVVSVTAGNTGAHFSKDGYVQLSHRAERNEVVLEAVARRRDVPTDQLPALVELVRAKASRTLAIEYGRSAEAMINEVTRSVAKKLGSDVGSPTALYRYFDAESLIEEKTEKGKLQDSDLIQWARFGLIEHVVAALSHLASTSLVTSVRAFHATDFQALLFVMRSADLSWAACSALFHAKSSGRVTKSELDDLRRSYSILSQEAARTVLNFLELRIRADS